MIAVRRLDGMRRARSRWASLSGNTRLKLYVIAAGILVVLWTIVPFFWMVWASLMTKPEIVEGIVQAIDRPVPIRFTHTPTRGKLCVWNDERKHPTCSVCLQ